MEDQKNITLFIAIGCLAFGLFIAAFIVFMIKYQRRMYAKEIKIRTMSFLKQIELFKASSEAEEKEKERIARNLHDQINPLLTVLKQNLQRHRFDSLKGNFSPDKFENDFEIIDKAIEGIRTSTYDLIPSFMLDYGLLKSLEDYIRSINDAKKIAASFTTALKQEEYQMPFIKQEQLNIYRASLEIINNILNHSGGTFLDMNVSASGGALTFEFTYDGQGISNAEINKMTGSGLGLKSLKARALILNAVLDYTRGGNYSSVKFIIPFRHE